MQKVIHRLWLGPAEMPAHYRQWGLDWQQLNPDWVVKDWRQQEIESIRWQNQAVYDDLGVDTHPIAAATQRADVLGYEIVHRFGGLYVNVDLQPIRPLKPLCYSELGILSKPMISMEDEYWVTNGVLWSPNPGDPFWQQVIDALPASYFDNPGKMMNETTGPHLLHRIMQQYKGPLLVLDKQWFNPLHYSQVQAGKDAEFDIADLPAKTIAVHHWGHKLNQRPHVAKV